MRLLHIADLHIGKRVNEFSMLEDQAYVLDQIQDMVKERKPDGILIAGDVYDKTQPSAEAVELLDDFLTKLSEKNCPIFMISGNHDSPERLGFGSRIMKKNGLHIAGVFDGKIQKEVLEDKYGKVNIYMLPFLKPAKVNQYYEEQIETYEEAIRKVMETAEINKEERNILIAHQFITSGGQKPEQSDSETLSIGGLDNIDISAFDDFDYVALGHIHRPQKIGRDTIRYAGSPLKYSFSESKHHKSVTLLEITEEINVELIPLVPCHDLREIKGPIEELLKIGREDKEFYLDYIHATLTDEGEIYDAIGQLRQVYPNLMAMDFDNSRTKQNVNLQGATVAGVAKKTPIELFGEFFQMQNNNDLTKAEAEIMKSIFEQVGGESI
ncbi:MAG: exonuclease SbcCD subunit D [Anaerovoracaceae bacterium]